MHPTIEFYLNRDGETSTRETLQRQLLVSVSSVVSAESHASLPEYRARFLEDAKAYAAYLGEPVARQVLEPLKDSLTKKQATATGRQLLFIEQFLKALELPSLEEGLELMKPMPQKEKPVLLSVEDKLERALARLRENGLPTADLENPL